MAGQESRHLVTIDCRVNVIPILHLDHAEDIVDAQPLQPVDGQRGRQRRDQHVVPCERLEDVSGDDALALPLERVLVEMLVDEGAACLLPFQVRGRVVGRGQAEEPWRLGEGNGR